MLFVAGGGSSVCGVGERVLCVGGGSSAHELIM